MKNIKLLKIIVLTGVFATGCKYAPKHASPIMSAPTGGAIVSEHVAKAALSTERAKQKIETIKVQGAKPNDPLVQDLATDIAETSNELATANTSLEKYKSDVAHQADLLNNAIDQKNAAIEKADYWHEKQEKALHELWLWRGIAGVIFLSVLGFVGFKLFAGGIL